MLLTALLAVSAPAARAQLVRDSAGIRIVHSDKPSWTAAQQLRLSAAPTLVIGDRDDEPYLLSQVKSPFQLTDGRIVLANAASSELRIYDAKGTYLKTVARSGDGPGEFRSIEKISRLAGDTMVVFHGRGDVSVFTGNGTFIRRMSVTRPTASNGRPTAFINAALILNGGVRLLTYQPLGRDNGPVGKRFDAMAPHSLVAPDNRVLKDLGLQPVMESIYEKDGPRYVWLCATELNTSNGNSFYLGYGTEYSVRRYTAQGQLDQIVRRAWTPHKLTKSDITTFLDEWLLRWSKTAGPERERDRADMLDDPYAINLPAYSAVLVDRTGKLWVRTPKPIDAAVAGFLYSYAIGPSAWSVFGTDGRWLGDVTMPARFMPSDIGADFVLGVARDDDGVQTVVKYTLGVR
ncbi:MAG: hypothetical protein H7Z40_03880 [Phycisphaerae bacterium]|nr:hypothetical protein [Gemmatimonadaceae bacterium]